MANVGTAYISIMPSTKGMGSSLSQQMSSEGGVAGNTFGSSLASTAIKVLAAVGIGAAVKKFFSEALDAGAELQQSFGGLDTIYGEASDSMKKMAYEAAQAGISANDYAEQAVSFGASLKQAFGGDATKAAEAANIAIMDMADNAAKMGTPIENIQMAYQGFARGQYQLLDNLKLGYGGTKEEMERLLEDAQALTGVEYNIDNLGDVYEAIHVIQGELGLTGVAAQEGAETFEGSMNAMKASAKNLLANLALGEDIKEPLNDLIENTKAFLFNNFFPMIGNILQQLPGILGEGLNWAFQNIPGMIDSVITFINNLASGMAENAGVFKEKLVEIGHAAMEMFKSIDWAGLGSAILNLLWTGLQTVGPIIWDGLKWIGETAYEWFKGVDWVQLGKDALQLIWDGLQALGNIIWEKLKEIGQTAYDWYKEVDWMQLGKDVIKFIWEGLGAIGSWIWDKLKLIGEAAVEKMKEVDWVQLGKDVITFIWNGLGEIGSWIWEKLQLLGEAAVEKFKEIDWVQLGKDVIDFIVEGIKNIGHTIWEKLKEVGEDARDKFLEIDWVQLGKDVIDAIWEGIKSVGGWVVDGISWLAEKGAGIFSGSDSESTVDWYGAGQYAVEEIGEAVENNGWHTSDAMSDVAYDAADALFHPDWYGLGDDMVSGVADGVSWNGYKIYNELHYAAVSAFNAVKSWLWIGSPSKRMRDQIGKWIPLGIAEGIEDEAGAVSDAMLDIAKEASTSIDTGFAYNATIDAMPERANTQSGGIVVNVYPSQGMDERELADKVIDRITFLQRQNQAAWGTA